MAEAYSKATSTPASEADHYIVRSRGTRPDLLPGFESGETDDQPAAATTDSNTVSVTDNKELDDVQRISTQPAGLGLARIPHGVKQTLQAQIQSETSKVSYIALYRYADTWDLIIVATSALCAIAGGAALPLLSVWIIFRAMALNESLG